MSEKPDLVRITITCTKETAAAIKAMADARDGASERNLSPYIAELLELDSHFREAAILVSGRRLPPRIGISHVLRDYFWQLRQPGHGPKERPPVIILPEASGKLLAEATRAFDALARSEAQSLRSRTP